MKKKKKHRMHMSVACIEEYKDRRTEIIKKERRMEIRKKSM